MSVPCTSAPPACALCFVQFCLPCGIKKAAGLIHGTLKFSSPRQLPEPRFLPRLDSLHNFTPTLQHPPFDGFSTLPAPFRHRSNRMYAHVCSILSSAKVYDRLPADARPMPCPLSPFVSSSSSAAAAAAAPAAVSSPLPRTPEALAALADAVLEWGKIYSGEEGARGGGIGDGSRAASAGAAPEEEEEACDVRGGGVVAETKLPVGGHDDGDDCGAAADRDEGERRSNTNPPEGNPGVRTSAAEGAAAAAAAPTTAPSSAAAATAAAAAAAAGTTAANDPPWETGRFALEMQAPWARRLLDGQKTVETRGYSLPAGLVGRSIELMESRPGQDGLSSVGDTVEAFADGLSVVGRVVFSGSSAYPSREAWAADAARHLVPVAPQPAAAAAAATGDGGSGSGGGKGYGWKGPGSVHAWTVGSVAAYPKPRAVRGMERAFRSLFLVEEQRRGGGGSSSGGAAAPNGQGVANDGAAVAGSGGDGDGSTKKKKKPKKKRKRKGPPPSSADGEEAEQAPADTGRAAEDAVAAAGAVGAPGAEGPPPVKTGGEETKRRKRPRAAGADGKLGISAAGRDATSLGSAVEDAPPSRGIGGGGGADRNRPGGGKKKRSGKGSAELRDGNENRGGGNENGEAGGEGTIIAALAAAAASARGTGDGFGGVMDDEGAGGAGGGGSSGGAPLAKPGRGDARKRSKKKRRF